jgi:hypothetical protein
MTTAALAVIDLPQAGYDTPYRMTPTGLHIDRELTYAEYEQAVHSALAIKSMASWALADLIVYGETMLGDKYTQAFEVSDYAMQTIYNYAPVGYAFPPESRVYDNLAFDHYREVSVKYLDDEQRHELLSTANALVEGKRDFLRDSKREIRNLPAKPQPYVAFDVVRGGKVSLVELPTRYEGKQVKITVSILEDVA